jgi:hypothetical protein
MSGIEIKFPKTKAKYVAPPTAMGSNLFLEGSWGYVKFTMFTYKQKRAYGVAQGLSIYNS